MPIRVDDPVAEAQHAFDVFPSIRSAHVVRGVEHFLDWAHAQALTPVNEKNS